MRAKLILMSLVTVASLGGAACAGNVTSAGEAASSCRGAKAMASPASCPKETLGVTPNPASEPARQRGPQRNRRYCRGGLRTDRGLAEVCALGVSPAKAVRHAALVGDSHSAQWRPALDRIARQRGWSILSTTASGCDLRVAATSDADCAAWRRQVPGWLARHPEIDLVIFGQVAKRGDAARTGYRRAWAALPPSVKRLVTIRDTPLSRDNVRTCIRRALARSRPPGSECATRRAAAEREDAAAETATSIGAPRAGAIDLSRYFCSSTRCFPVIGGILVYADGNHQTPQFNATLAPYLGAELDRVLAP